MSVNEATRQAVRERASYLCEYCHSPERLSANRFTVDHVIPKSLGGADDINNLALACRRCNERRYNFVAGVDPDTQAIVPLFNLRQQQWAEHCIWIGISEPCITKHLTLFPDSNSDFMLQAIQAGCSTVS